MGKQLYIYIVRTDLMDYDTLRGATVAAENELEAVELTRVRAEPCHWTSCTVKYDVRLVGAALDNVEKGILLEDFLNG